MFNKDKMMLAVVVLMVVVIAFNAFAENFSTDSPKGRGSWKESSGNSEFYTLNRTDSSDGITIRREVKFSGPIYIWVEFESGSDLTLTVTNLTQDTTDVAVFPALAGSLAPNIGLNVNEGDALLISIKGAAGTKYRFGYSQEYKANGAWLES